MTCKRHLLAARARMQALRDKPGVWLAEQERRRAASPPATIIRICIICEGERHTAKTCPVLAAIYNAKFEP